MTLSVRDARTFTIFERDSKGRYSVAQSVSEGVIDKITKLRGLRVDVDALWVKIESLG